MTPQNVRLEPMTSAEFDYWSPRSVQGFAAQLVAAGLSSSSEASAYAVSLVADTLPEGMRTPAHRFWAVRVDGGPPVGYLWLRVRSTPDHVEAYVFDIEIVPEARGQGLGRATMLAVEAEARDLGATVARLNVFGHNTPARALYDGLGYTVASATLTARLAGRPAERVAERVADQSAEPEVGLRRMTPAEYTETRPALDAAAAGELHRLLPDGPATGGQRLWVAEHGGSVVGRVWLSLQNRSDGLHGLVRDLEVRPDLRRRGYGRSTLLAAERAAKDLGVVTLTVTVTDPGAHRLFIGVGFELTAQTMTKAL